MGLTNKNKKLFDFVAKYYDKRLIEAWLNGILKKALGNLKIKNNSKILDAGCGTGNLLFLLEKQGKYGLYGIDISPKMLEKAGKKLKKSTLKLISVENIKWKNKFDYIFSTEAFHHYENQEKAMKNFHNALKENGKLAIVDLDFGIFNWVFHKIEPGNNRMNSSADFYRLFEIYRFKDIRQKNPGFFAIMTIEKK